MTDDNCIHCILGRVLMAHLKDNPKITGVEIAHSLGTIMRDILMSNGHSVPADAPPTVVGPLLTAFMMGMELKLAAEPVQIDGEQGETRH